MKVKCHQLLVDLLPYSIQSALRHSQPGQKQGKSFVGGAMEFLKSSREDCERSLLNRLCLLFKHSEYAQHYRFTLPNTVITRH